MNNKIERARIAGKLNREAIEYGFELAKPGVTLFEIDRELGEFISSHEDCVPAFKGYHGFPGNSCMSVNEVAVHGVPNDYVLRVGDLLTIDIGTIYDGIFADAATTKSIGKPYTEENINLIDAVESILIKQMSHVKDGCTLYSIAKIGESTAKRYGVNIVEDLGGHYIGENLHMDPFIPNCIDRRKGGLNAQIQEKKYLAHKLRAGDVICIEPVITIGNTDLTIDPDGWTCRTAKLSAHAEHMLLVTKDGYEILS